MRLRSIVLGLALLAQTPTAAHSEPSWQASIKERLRDPDSAKFRDVVSGTVNGVRLTCGYINAKNGFGGYDGYDLFVVVGGKAMTNQDLWDMAATLGRYPAFHDEAAALCTKLWMQEHLSRKVARSTLPEPAPAR